MTESPYQSPELQRLMQQVENSYAVPASPSLPTASSATHQRKHIKAPQLAKIGAAFAGLCIGGSFWIIGGRFTIDGIMWCINWLLMFLSVPLQISLPLPWFVYFYLSPIPILFSVVEWNTSIRQMTVALFCVWLIVSGMDILSTFIGLGIPSTNASQVTQWFHASTPAKGVSAAFLTFWPEWLIRRMVKILRQELSL